MYVISHEKETFYINVGHEGDQEAGRGAVRLIYDLFICLFAVDTKNSLVLKTRLHQHLPHLVGRTDSLINTFRLLQSKTTFLGLFAIMMTFTFHFSKFKLDA